MGFSAGGIPEVLLAQAARRARTAQVWKGQTAKGRVHDWDVHAGCEMGLEDLEQWVLSLVRKGGGYPVRLSVYQMEGAQREKPICSGTIWRVGPDWEDEDEDDQPTLRSLVPIEEGFDVGDAKEEADSPFEKLILLCMEKPQIVGSLAAKAVELAQPAIDTAVSPILEVMIEQVSEKTSEKTVLKMRRVLEEMLEFEDDDDETPAEELQTEPEPEIDEEEDEELVMLRRLELEDNRQTIPRQEEEPEDDERIEAEIQHCWAEHQAQSYETAEA